MDRQADKKLSASQEDYLEAIWALTWKQGMARVSDIANHLDVSMPSVTGALKVLAKRDLVEYSPHKYVTLTDSGLELAENISARHDVLRRFLTDVLGLDEDIADRNACRIEHAVDETTSRKLTHFVEFILQHRRGKQWPQQFQEYCDTLEQVIQDEHADSAEAAPGPRKHKDSKTALTLADIKPGGKARIVSINSSAKTNHRLAVMGMTHDSVVSVVRIAPLGDLIEVKIRGYSLSLRKSQARGVNVEAM